MNPAFGQQAAEQGCLLGKNGSGTRVGAAKNSN
jgi:hypothetical protein